jgi:hypothetical protein
MKMNDNNAIKWVDFRIRNNFISASQIQSEENYSILSTKGVCRKFSC